MLGNLSFLSWSSCFAFVVRAGAALSVRCRHVVLLATALAGLSARGQTPPPGADPVMVVTNADGSQSEETSFDGSAPLRARFEARPKNVGALTARYEWQFSKEGESRSFLLRYDENTDYTFAQSGVFTVRLLISFVDATGSTSLYEMDTPFRIAIAESKLEVPNAFTPNGDGVNDVFRVKEGYRSIVEFRAIVVNRGGKKVAEWSDPADGWDGRDSGGDAPDGAYYLLLRARGADGKRYEVKKVINLLRRHLDSTAPTP